METTMIAPLSPRQASFAQALVQGYCTSAAARTAGYAGDWRFAWARHVDPAIAARVKALREGPARGEWPLPEEPIPEAWRPISHEEWMATYARPALAEGGGATKG